MKTNCFSIYDEKSETYGVPFFMLNNQMALRAFADLGADPETTIGKHPEDYKLYQIGVFDDSTSKLTHTQPPEYLATARNPNYENQGIHLREPSSES